MISYTKTMKLLHKRMQ